MINKINLHNVGFVELLEFMGGDQAIVEAARVCYQSKGNEQADKRFIEMLVREEHKSPLEHCVFRFKVKAPLFVVRQWMRHRIGSYNEKSLRYCKANPEFYIPECLNEVQKHYLNKHYKQSFELYLDMLNDGVPREKARIVLPLAIYTKFVWTVNASSLYNFLKLRLDKHAQSEIREYAIALLKLAKSVVPITFGMVEEKIINGVKINAK